jgi:integrase
MDVLNSLTVNSRHKHEWMEKGNFIICKFCKKKKLKLKQIATDVFQGTKSDGTNYAVRANRDRIFYPQEWKEFFSKLKDSQTFTFKFLLLTGARIMEIQYVKVEDIDFTNQRIILKKTKQRSGDNIKNKSKTRTLRVSRELIKDIRKQVEDYGLKKEDYLVTLSQPACHLALKKTLQLIKIKDWKMFSLHNIRKTSENWALAIGVDSMKLSKRFGHNLITQYEHYSQSDAFNQKEKEMIREIFGDTFIE